MSDQKYAVVLRQKVSSENLKAVVESLAAQLDVKEKTAHQILQHIPLKVYSHLTFGEARILVEALNIVTRCQWEVMLESEVNFPAANWNKKPTIMGMGLETLMKKNDPKVTGVARYVKGESMNLPSSSSLNQEGEADESALAEETILESADTVIKNLSADLDRVLEQGAGGEVMQTQVLSAMQGDIKEEAMGSGNALEKGFYNLYLPELSGDEKEVVLEISMESLGMEASEVQSILGKSIPCIGRNLDEVESLRLIKLFAEEGIKLKHKLRSKA